MVNNWSEKPRSDVEKSEHQDSADAKRVILNDTTGDNIDDNNPLPVSIPSTTPLNVREVDSEGNPLTSVEGNFENKKTSDLQSQEILRDILIELKKLNLNIAHLSDNFLNDEDVK